MFAMDAWGGYSTGVLDLEGGCEGEGVVAALRFGGGDGDGEWYNVAPNRCFLRAFGGRLFI